MIYVTSEICIDEREIEETFVHSSGAGGQNINKVATAVQLRFDVAASPNLPPAVKARLVRLAGQRLTSEGVLVIIAQRLRTQDGNRRDALERLLALLREASIAPRHRFPTKPTAGSRRRRLEAKSQRSRLKALRGARPEAD